MYTFEYSTQYVPSAPVVDIKVSSPDEPEKETVLFLPWWILVPMQH